MDSNRKDCLSHWMNAMHNRAEGKMEETIYSISFAMSLYGSDIRLAQHEVFMFSAHPKEFGKFLQDEIEKLNRKMGTGWYDPKQGMRLIQRPTLHASYI